MKKEHIVLAGAVIAICCSALLALGGQSQEISDEMTLLLLLPILSFIVVIFRNLVGIHTYGTFGPVILGIAFYRIGIISALLLYGGILLFGAIINHILKKLEILSLPLTSLTIAFVAIALLYLHELTGINLMGSLELPFLITAYMIDTFNDKAESMSLRHALSIMVQTLLVALIAGLLASALSSSLYLISILLLTISLTLLISLYTGARLLEILRFKRMVQ